MGDDRGVTVLETLAAITMLGFRIDDASACASRL